MKSNPNGCSHCDQETEKLNELSSVKLLAQLETGWVILEKSTPQLTKTYQVKNFSAAQTFANQVGQLAEEENHHPAILIEWGQVTLYWTTHRVNGLTLLDFEMAATSDLIFSDLATTGH